MTEEESLMATIIEYPDDDTPRLVFADWLQENGEYDRAEFIRIQCELAKGFDHKRIRQLQIRELKLSRSLDLRNRIVLPVLNNSFNFPNYPEHIRGSLRYATLNDITYWRGFVENLRCTQEDWILVGKKIIKQLPLRRVFISYKEPDFSGNYYWWSSRGAAYRTPSDIDYEIYVFLSQPRCILSGGLMRKYPNKLDAMADLSNACIRLAKFGNSPLTPDFKMIERIQGEK